MALALIYLIVLVIWFIFGAIRAWRTVNDIGDVCGFLIAVIAFVKIFLPLLR